MIRLSNPIPCCKCQGAIVKSTDRVYWRGAPYHKACKPKPEDTAEGGPPAATS